MSTDCTLLPLMIFWEGFDLYIALEIYLIRLSKRFLTEMICENICNRSYQIVQALSKLKNTNQHVSSLTV